MPVRGPESLQAPVPGLSYTVQVATAPAEGLGSHGLEQHVSHLARMAAIAVREGMDGDETMMERAASSSAG